MSPYILFVIWIISIIAFELIARRRGATPGLFWRFVVISLGPLAVPLAFLTRPTRDRQQRP